MMALIRAEREARERNKERERVNRDADAIRARCQSLAGFVREAWRVLEPNTSLVWNWHLDAICQHLEAVTRGDINRLLINVPPGSSKSLIVSVLWPAWEWIARPSLRYVTTSFNDDNVTRDTRKCRDLVRSEWYRSLWPEIVLSRAGETSFANTSHGNREGSAFKSLTGKRGDRLIIDDPHSTETAESDADRATATRIFREGATDRLNDLEKSAIIVIMQRLHADDISGVIKRLDTGYVHLCLPMEFEADRQCITYVNGKEFFRDPRTYDGELLDPIRFGPVAIEKLRKEKTSYAWAGQYQQRPAPREGGMFKRHWFADKIIGAAPAGTQWVRHWDLAATRSNDAARTAGVKLGKAPDGKFIVGHVVKTQSEGADVRRLILATAQSDGRPVQISLPQDPGQAGKVQAQDMVQMLAGFVAKAAPETGDKVTRAEPFAAQCEAGNVYLVSGEWNESYVDELCEFPSGKFKDQVDASSGAFGALLQNIRPAPIFGTYGSGR